MELLPLSPREVQDEQLRIKQAYASAGSSSSRRESSTKNKTKKSSLLYMQKLFFY